MAPQGYTDILHPFPLYGTRLLRHILQRGELALAQEGQLIAVGFDQEGVMGKSVLQEGAMGIDDGLSASGADAIDHVSIEMIIHARGHGAGEYRKTVFAQAQKGFPDFGEDQFRNPRPDAGDFKLGGGVTLQNGGVDAGFPLHMHAVGIIQLMPQQLL